MKMSLKSSTEKIENTGLRAKNQTKNPTKKNPKQP